MLLWYQVATKNAGHSLQQINPLNAELNPIYHLLALLGAHHILHISRIRVKSDNDEVLPCQLNRRLFL